MLFYRLNVSERAAECPILNSPVFCTISFYSITHFLLSLGLPFLSTVFVTSCLYSIISVPCLKEESMVDLPVPELPTARMMSWSLTKKPAP